MEHYEIYISIIFTYIDRTNIGPRTPKEKENGKNINNNSNFFSCMLF